MRLPTRLLLPWLGCRMNRHHPCACCTLLLLPPRRKDSIRSQIEGGRWFFLVVCVLQVGARTEGTCAERWMGRCRSKAAAAASHPSSSEEQL